jgi:hypothetical protein
MPKRLQATGPTDESPIIAMAGPEREMCIWVGEGSAFANPFTMDGCREAGYQGTDEEIAERCKCAYKVWLGPSWRENWQGSESESRRKIILDHLPFLRGQYLACSCDIDKPCHADILLEMANEGLEDADSDSA